MSDLERVLGEAQKARDEAEAAVRRANELAGQATAAQERAELEKVERRRQWAQTLIDGYDAEVGNADAEIQEAQERFDTVAVENIAGAVAAYVAWGEASMRHYGLQIRIAAAADVLGHEATRPELVQIPPFSAAIDSALAGAIAKRGVAAREEAEAELAKLRDDA